MGIFMAAIAVAGEMVGYVNASNAEKEAADAEKYQNLFDLVGFEKDTSIQQYNLTVEAGQVKSSQIASAASMGKRSTGGSVGNIIDVSQEGFQRDINLLQQDVDLAKKSGKVTRSAIDRLASSRNKQRAIQSTSQGLLSVAKIFSDT